MGSTLKVVAAVLAAVAMDAIAAESASWERTQAPPVPEDNTVTYARVELGKRLFFDTRLSASGTTSCATCHNPAFGWSDGLPTALGHGQKAPQRRTPTLLNAAYNTRQALEEQAMQPVASAEMGLDLARMVERLESIKGYRVYFDQAYPREGINPRTVAKAIATFERTLVSRTSPFDRWQDGERTAVSPAVARGFALFRGKANCIGCHEGPQFTDGGLHNVGVRGAGGETDRGGAHRTPSLRDVVYTAPYMHNGAYRTLREVVEMYSRGGDEPAKADPKIRKLGLTPSEIDDVVAFLESLAGDPVVVAAPQLPY